MRMHGAVHGWISRDGRDRDRTVPVSRGYKISRATGGCRQNPAVTGDLGWSAAFIAFAVHRMRYSLRRCTARNIRPTGNQPCRTIAQTVHSTSRTA